MGKLLAGLFGWILGGLIGALIGIIVGHQFDRGLGFYLKPISREQRILINQSFFETLFQLAGHLAKADGHISAPEINQAEEIMRRMGLDAHRRNDAISLFKAGAATDFSIDETLSAFARICSSYNNLKLQLIKYLISLAIADEILDESEERILRRIATELNFPASTIDQIFSMIGAQETFGKDKQSVSNSGRIDMAYSALGIPSTSSDMQVKKAYRTLISENHPDKLIGQGMPDDMVQLATERTQEIQAAYEIIVESRHQKPLE